MRIITSSEDGSRCRLHSPTAMPAAGAFLWNRRMMIQASCRGFAVARFMQPEPASYARGPNIEATTFMQPEQPYYAHHPGRFLYIKDELSGALFSAPHEPVRAVPDSFCFTAAPEEITWEIQKHGLRATMRLSLPVDDAVELWQCEIANESAELRQVSVYPYFPVGYMSWMNQSAEYRADLGGIVCSSVTPYQKVEDYFKNRDFKDKTFFLHETAPDAWEACQQVFEGEGGLHNPDAIRESLLDCGDARYQVPTAVLQYRLQLQPGERRTLRFLFGPARDEGEIQALRERYLSTAGFAAAAEDYRRYLEPARGCLRIDTPDRALDDFVNHWLPRQVFYHGDVNRLTTDPQTRNYLQDQLGMAYIRPHTARAAFLHALGQQEPDGAMPDGILLEAGAELKYINQVPHTDHCVWLPVSLCAYLDETGDHTLLDESVPGQGGRSVFECVCRALDHLAAARDERGLSYIGQGDWCDPMNMAGYRGKGISGWLSLAVSYALKLWAGICGQRNQDVLADKYLSTAEAINRAVNRHLWDGDWFARGITDDGVAFGVREDREGRIYLNPQSWALLSGAADSGKRARILRAVEEQLETPFGPMMLAPAYTAMREDVGRLTQKHPGSAENGSVYNHAAVFYIYSLYETGEGDSARGEAEKAWQLLRKMIPGPDPQDLLRRGQLPVFVPNYYRGAWHQYPEHAGRSSQLFNTGTAAWLYRCVLEQLFGLKGEPAGLRIAPQLPSHWQRARVERRFRGAVFEVDFIRASDVETLRVELDGEALPEPLISPVEAGRRYRLRILLPAVAPSPVGCAARTEPESA